ncbi:hypothetical protein H2198_005326 [Neophaeococcomyces mojaviensis]|uniref:Uncharacterized protein n=1 Tax=Neophaeococcomyces mojaviensis TaxID=3383035 RepID=A0ACC3A6F4_9EURO|nr:hypothetical protein H2198_005326 [Knufia sp. JES_112]
MHTSKTSKLLRRIRGQPPQPISRKQCKRSSVDTNRPKKQVAVASQFAPATGVNSTTLQDSIVPFPYEVSNLIYEYVIAHSKLRLAYQDHNKMANYVRSERTDGFGLRCTGSTILSLLLVSKSTHEQMNELIKKADIMISTDDLHHTKTSGTPPVESVRQATLTIPMYHYENPTVGSRSSKSDIDSLLTTLPRLQKLTITNNYTVQVAGTARIDVAGEDPNRRLPPYERLYFGTSLDPRVVGYPADEQARGSWAQSSVSKRAPFTYEDMERMPRYCVARSFATVLFAWNANTPNVPTAMELKIEVVDEIGRVYESVQLYATVKVVENMTLSNLSRCVGKVTVNRSFV